MSRGSIITRICTFFRTAGDDEVKALKFAVDNIYNERFGPKPIVRRKRRVKTNGVELLNPGEREYREGPTA